MRRELPYIPTPILWIIVELLFWLFIGVSLALANEVPRSIKWSGTNVITYWSPISSNAYARLNFISVTNADPDSPRLLSAVVQWTTPLSIAVSSNLTDWTTQNVVCSIRFSEPLTNGQKLYRVPLAPVTQQVVLPWNPSSDGLAVGYNVYYGTESGIYTRMIPAGDVTEVVITSLQSGVTYYFAVTAYDALGRESVRSNEVRYTVPFTDVQPTINLQR